MALKIKENHANSNCIYKWNISNLHYSYKYKHRYRLRLNHREFE